MSEPIQLRIGERPWLPTPNTESVEIFDRYDMPISGLIKQGSHLYVFDCIEGHVMASNVWVYAEVDDREAQSLQDAEGDQFDQLFKQAFEGRPVMAALATDLKIRSGSEIEKRKIVQSGLLRSVLDRLREGVESAGETAKAIRLTAC